MVKETLTLFFAKVHIDFMQISSLFIDTFFIPLFNRISIKSLIICVVCSLRYLIFKYLFYLNICLLILSCQNLVVVIFWLDGNIAYNGYKNFAKINLYWIALVVWYLFFVELYNLEQSLDFRWFSS